MCFCLTLSALVTLKTRNLTSFFFTHVFSRKSSNAKVKLMVSKCIESLIIRMVVVHLALALYLSWLLQWLQCFPVSSVMDVDTNTSSYLSAMNFPLQICISAKCRVSVVVGPAAENRYWLLMSHRPAASTAARIGIPPLPTLTWANRGTSR